MPELPSSDERTVIIGPTGSGKTQFGVWLLSTRDYYNRVWFILDFKGERIFPRLHMRPWQFGDPMPQLPGLYWVRVIPGSDQELSQLFLDIYNQENIGVYIDEGMQLPKEDRWFKALLTQGRSKNIEIIVLTQRPRRVDISIFTEASYFCVFNLTLKDDRKRVEEFTEGLDLERLPKYYSHWYEVGEQDSVVFEPVPSADEIVETFLEFEEEQEKMLESDEQKYRPIEL